MFSAFCFSQKKYEGGDDDELIGENVGKRIFIFFKKKSNFFFVILLSSQNTIFFGQNTKQTGLYNQQHSSNLLIFLMIFNKNQGSSVF